MTLTETEKRVLVNIHLAGKMGNMGAMNQKARLTLLNGLIAKGLLTQSANLTQAGVNACLINQ